MNDGELEIFDTIDGDWNVLDKMPGRAKRRFKSPLTVEIALFLDAVVLDNLYSFYTEDQVIDLILSLMNNVSQTHASIITIDALNSHSSLFLIIILY